MASLRLCPSFQLNSKISSLARHGCGFAAWKLTPNRCAHVRWRVGRAELSRPPQQCGVKSDPESRKLSQRDVWRQGRLEMKVQWTVGNVVTSVLSLISCATRRVSPHGFYYYRVCLLSHKPALMCFIFSIECHIALKCQKITNNLFFFLYIFLNVTTSLPTYLIVKNRMRTTTSPTPCEPVRLRQTAPRCD